MHTLGLAQCHIRMFGLNAQCTYLMLPLATYRFCLHKAWSTTVHFIGLSATWWRISSQQTLHEKQPKCPEQNGKPSTSQSSGKHIHVQLIFTPTEMARQLHCTCTCTYALVNTSNELHTCSFITHATLTRVKQLSMANMTTSIGVVWLATHTVPHLALLWLGGEGGGGGQY